MVTTGTDAASVESCEDIDVDGSNPRVAVGELEIDIVSGDFGNGLSSDIERPMAGKASDAGVGTCVELRFSWSSKAERDAAKIQ